MKETYNSLGHINKEQSDDILKLCYDKIRYLTEHNIEQLYMSIDNFLFQDIDYSQVISFIPIWVADAGISAESGCSKDFYEEMRDSFSHPYLNRFIYHYDLWSLVAAIQDRLQTVEKFMKDYYKSIPCHVSHNDEEYSSAVRCCDQQIAAAFSSLNNIFVALSSVFDLLAKVATEQYQFPKYDFVTYKKMKSDNILYNYTNNKIHPELKEEGLLFSAPLNIKKILTFRNEYVHNGPWDLNCCLYYTYINGVPADVIMFAPDMDDNGNFITSGSRNKFYSQNNKINIQLPYMVIDIIEILQRTIDKISCIYMRQTINKENPELTMECIDALLAIQHTQI